MIIDWLRKHRFSVVFVGVVLGGFILFIIPIFAYFLGYLSDTMARLIMTGLGAFGTAILAGITILTLMSNQVLVRERVKERERPLMRDMLEKIVWPALDTLDENQDNLKSEDTDWTTARELPQGLLGPKDLSIDFDLIAQRGDPLTSDRFSTEFPDTSHKMSQYDRKLIRLGGLAHEVINDLREPIAEYIEANGLTYESQKQVDPLDVINLLMIGDRPARDDERPDYWVENKQDFKRLSWEHSQENLEGFNSLQTEIFNYSNEVRQALIEVREEIEPEYGLYWE